MKGKLPFANDPIAAGKVNQVIDFINDLAAKVEALQVENATLKLRVEKLEREVGRE
jgi:cell division septum initiation protein DivIVA